MCVHVHLFSYLAGGLDSFPDAEIDQNPDSHQAQDELPVKLTGLVQTWGDVQHLVSAQSEEDSYITAGITGSQHSLAEINVFSPGGRY